MAEVLGHPIANEDRRRSDNIVLCFSSNAIVLCLLRPSAVEVERPAIPSPSICLANGHLHYNLKHWAIPSEVTTKKAPQGHQRWYHRRKQSVEVGQSLDDGTMPESDADSDRGDFAGL